MRVVSLVPSATETLTAWNITPIAVTRFCERPDLPSVGGTKNPDIAAILALAPDLVVMNIEENRKEDAAALAEAGIPVHVIAIDRVAEVLSEMQRLAIAVGRHGAPAPLDGWAAPEPPPPALTAFVPIWRRPWMTIGPMTYGASILEAVGITPVYVDASTRYPETTLDAMAGLRPDVVLAPSEPYAFTERHRAELEVVAPMHGVDGKDVFWWGARTPGAVERLRAFARELAQTLRR